MVSWLFKKILCLLFLCAAVYREFSVQQHLDVPLEVMVNVKSFHDFSEDQDPGGNISRRGFCVGGDEDCCTGDAFGGIFSNKGNKWLLRGVASVSKRNNSLDSSVCSHAVYTNVENLIDWTETILGGVKLKCNIDRMDSDSVCRVEGLNRENTELLGDFQGKDSTKIRAVYFDALSDLAYLPIKLGNFFPNIESYYVSSSGVKKLIRRNFENLTNITHISLCLHLISCK